MTTRSEFVFPLLLLGFVSSFFAPILSKYAKTKIHFILSIIPLSFFLFFLSFAVHLPLHGSFFSVTRWIEYLGIHLYFRLDALSLLFALLISFLGFLIFIYSGKYLKPTHNKGRFYCLLNLFMVAMIGLVLADHLLVLFLFWELTTFTSFLLIGFDHHKQEARESAWKAILVTTFGALAMLAGFILLGETVGTYRITQILHVGDLIKSSQSYQLILSLILLGALTKSAQFPFYFWLPNAMTAPTPISAYLHSVTMVKAGIYLLARLLPVLGHTPEWFYSLTILGSCTMLIGSSKAVVQDDLKLILAYLTLAVLGTMTMLLGVGSTYAIKGFLIYLIAHSFYKGSLFLAVGTIDVEKGTRKVSELSGLFKEMPLVSIAFILSLLTMVSFPPTLGMIAKEIIYKSHMGNFYLLGVTILTMALATTVGISILTKIFFQKSSRRIREKFLLWFPSLLLGVTVVLSGVFTWWIEMDFMKSFIGILIGDRFDDVIFGGIEFDQILLLSISTLFLGGILYLFEPYLKGVIQFFGHYLEFLSPERIFNYLKSGLLKKSYDFSLYSQRGYFHKYLSTILLSSIFILFIGLWMKRDSLMIPPYQVLSFYEWGLVGIIILSTISAILITNLIASVMLLGVLGFTLAIIFVSYGAPDLALTQLFVETLTIILFALIAIKYPRRNRHHFSSSQTKKDIVLATLFGSLMTVILWSVASVPFDRSLSRYFSDHSFTIAKGRNVVNVILVDFRALDTLGEITVLTIAGLGFFSLLKLSLRRRT